MFASAVARPRRDASRLLCRQCSHDASYLLVDQHHSGEDQPCLGHRARDTSSHHLLCRQCSQDASYLLVEDTDTVTEPEPLVRLGVRLVSRKAVRAQSRAARWSTSSGSRAKEVVAENLMIWIPYNPDSASHVGDTVAAAVDEVSSGGDGLANACIILSSPYPYRTKTLCTEMRVHMTIPW